MMVEGNQKRLDFTITLLTELKNACSILKELNSTIEGHSEGFYRRTFDESRREVQKDIEKYNSNIEKVHSLSNQIIVKMNEWYNFVKDPGEIKKITYPIKFMFKKRTLKKHIKNANSQISETTIENRFIKEHLSTWEHTLKSKAIQLINTGEDYKQHTLLIRKKEELVSELKYLLPTVCDSRHIELNLDDLDSLMNKMLSHLVLR